MHGVLFSPGTTWQIDRVQADGARQPLLALQPIDAPLADSAWTRVVAEWIADPPVRWSAPRALYVRAAELGRAATGRTLGSVLAGANGELFVRRRDADRSASAAARPTAWDLVRPDVASVERLTLAAGDSPFDIAAGRRVLLRRAQADGTIVLLVGRIVVEAPADDASRE